MFQVGSLVVLCGLLTGTSASLSEFIQKLDVPVNFSEKTEHQERTIENIVLLYDSMTLRRLNHSFYLNNMRDIFSGQRKRDLQAGLSSNDNSTEMKMLLIVDSSVYLPDDNPRKRAIISLKLLCFLRNVTESQNSLLYVTLWIWANETMKDISDSSGRYGPLGNNNETVEQSYGSPDLQRTFYRVFKY
nr:BPI fold-containing family A member 2-like [Peromyscus maniculatus bairdii]